MKHAGTYGRQSGRQLIDHEEGAFLADPLSDNCPLCLDPAGCPVNAHGVEDCRARHQAVATGAKYAYGALAAACAKHGVAQTKHATSKET
jgi:hypothetical protein